MNKVIDENNLRQRIKNNKYNIEINKVNDNENSHDIKTNNKTMSIEYIRERMQELQQDAVNKVDEYLNNVVTSIVDELENIEMNKQLNNTNDKYYNDKKKLMDSDILPEKHFQMRNSMLTDLCNNVNHLRSVYNIFVAVLIILFINSAVNDYFDTGSFQLGFSTMKLGFSKISYVVTMWIQMMAFTIVVYIFYTIWAYKRVKMQSKSFNIKLWDYSWLIIFIIYQILFLIIPPRLILNTNLPPPSICIILFEQLRIVMKIHAFVRSTIPSIISYKCNNEENLELKVPGFSNFIYFIFAPTIVYRDNYPRTREIKWSLVAWYLFEFFMTMCCVTFMFERYVIPIYKDYGLEEFNIKKFTLRYFNTILPGIVIFLCGFYCLLHTWMNAFAELLRFGDRLFYKDWWNSMSYDVYYRTWNVVVHDWLYVYIYKDIYEIIAPRNKFLSKFFVFFLSAIFHEYIIGMSLNLFCPIMLVVFGGVGFILIFITHKNNSAFGNIFLWFSLSTGSGFLVSLYAMEYFARINCPRDNNIYYLIMPRFWICYSEN